MRCHRRLYGGQWGVTAVARFVGRIEHMWVVHRMRAHSRRLGIQWCASGGQFLRLKACSWGSRYVVACNVFGSRSAARSSAWGVGEMTHHGGTLAARLLPSCLGGWDGGGERACEGVAPIRLPLSVRVL